MVDLSVGGAGLEHDTFLRPGDACALSFALNDDLYTFSARIQWTHAVLPTTLPTGGVRFRSGVAFDRIPSPAKPLLAWLLTR